MMSNPLSDMLVEALVQSTSLQVLDAIRTCMEQERVNVEAAITMVERVTLKDQELAKDEGEWSEETQSIMMRAVEVAAERMRTIRNTAYRVVELDSQTAEVPPDDSYMGPGYLAERDQIAALFRDRAKG